MLQVRDQTRRQKSPYSPRTPGALLDVPLDTLRSTYEINTFSILRVTKAVFPHMAARKSGEIINLGSIGGDM